MVLPLPQSLIIYRRRNARLERTLGIDNLLGNGNYRPVHYQLPHGTGSDP